MDFDEKRQMLLREAYDFKSLNEFDTQYSRSFFELVEDVILYLLQGEDNFFGQFMLKIKRGIRVDITAPIGTIPKRDGFNMYFNPFLFLTCDKKEMVALFKHEIYHIMYSHYDREREMKNRIGKEAIAVALDISINQYIKNLPGWSKRLNGINMEYNIELLENRSVEEYGEEIYKSIKSRIKEPKIVEESEFEYEINIEKSHDIWQEIDISKEDIESLTKKAAISAYSDNAPDGVKKVILGYKEKAEIPWQQVLKNILPSVKSGYKKTIMRRSRRQPERFDLRGVLPKRETEIIVAIDISASMTDKDLRKILLEILSITENSKDKITIIECDNEIRSIYKLKTEEDIRKRSRNNGSTSFTPVFRYIAENNLKNAVLIYFTDGVGEKELEIKPINKKILWVISGNEELSIKNPYGEVKRINTEKKEIIQGNEGLKMVNESIHDWAR